jgi:hypothetical protein
MVTDIHLCAGPEHPNGDLRHGGNVQPGHSTSLQFPSNQKNLVLANLISSIPLFQFLF